jgi:hypothetical protein
MEEALDDLRATLRMKVSLEAVLGDFSAVPMSVPLDKGLEVLLNSALLNFGLFVLLFFVSGLEFNFFKLPGAERVALLPVLARRLILLGCIVLAFMLIGLTMSMGSVVVLSLL